MSKDAQNAHVVAVVLAGGAADDPLALQAGVPAKALAPLDGKPLGLYVLEALEASKYVSSCVYVGPCTDALSAHVGRVVPAGRHLAESLAQGLTAAQELHPQAERVLVVTADLPWLEPVALDHCLEHAPRAALVYPIISQASAERQFPGQKRTYITIRDGTFTGGNLMVIEPRVIPKLLPLMNRAYRARKNLFAMAALLGPRMLSGFVTRTLTLAAIERRVSKLLEAEARAFETPYASLGADVDRLEHLVTPATSAPVGQV